MKTVDARGMACPAPVLETRKALGDPAVKELTVLVDNDAACENVARMARSRGCEVAVEQGEGTRFTIRLKREPGAGVVDDARDDQEYVSCAPAGRPVVFIATDTIGRGDDDLGRLLMIAFVKTLPQVKPAPKAILFMNAGVRLTVEGSEVLEALNEMESGGVELLVCGTCLDFYKVKDSLRVGKISNMFDIATEMMNAAHVVRP